MIVLLLCFGIYKNNRLTVPVKINDIAFWLFTFVFW
jgi:hypothetical protein